MRSGWAEVGRTAPWRLPSCCLCAPYVLPMCSHVDRNHMRAHREQIRSSQGERRRYVWATALPTMRECIHRTEHEGGTQRCSAAALPAGRFSGIELALVRADDLLALTCTSKVPATELSAGPGGAGRSSPGGSLQTARRIPALGITVPETPHLRHVPVPPLPTSSRYAVCLIEGICLCTPGPALCRLRG